MLGSTRAARPARLEPEASRLEAVRLARVNYIGRRRESGFQLLLTADRRIRYHQNLQARRIALVALTGSTKWARVQQQADRIAVAVAAATTGSYAEVEIPASRKRVGAGRDRRSSESKNWNAVLRKGRVPRVDTMSQWLWGRQCE
jgi:hypothetical protein